MTAEQERWEGRTEARIAGLEHKFDEFADEVRGWMHRMNDTVQGILLDRARDKGRIEGGRLVFGAVCTVVGGAVTLLVTLYIGH